eukprot:TRINITY_DN30612_c0_g1_i1.p1 TRINITY_DN30612_c0_g1~~TRINITY_DN30612_c0_g1_i1.p1  ORF type:complete len:363 (-),score=45.60 TRINITY_DN30612_c0_g1_i1:119-1153(-)
MDRSRRASPTQLSGHVRYGANHVIEKLSPPQKRRRRLQRSAIRHALVLSDGLKEICGVQSDQLPITQKFTEDSPSVVANMLQRVEFKLELIQNSVQLLMQSLTNTCFEKEWGPYRDADLQLNPDAPEFAPAGQAAGHTLASPVNSSSELSASPLQAFTMRSWEPLPFLSMHDRLSVRGVSKSHAAIGRRMPDDTNDDHSCSVIDSTTGSATVDGEVFASTRVSVGDVKSRISGNSGVATGQAGFASHTSGELNMGFAIRVRWDGTLAADDICEYFEKYGTIQDFDFLDEQDFGAADVARIRFTCRASAVDAMRQSRHRIRRVHDGEIIQCIAYVKFSDNARVES